MPVVAGIARAVDAALQATNSGHQSMAATEEIFPSGKPAVEASAIMRGTHSTHSDSGHCPLSLSGRLQAHTVTGVKSKVPTLKWTVPLCFLQRPTLSLQ